jgi:hypothetical protein
MTQPSTPASDPFQRAKDIRAGKLDHEMPDYDELTGWIQRVPITWLGGLLRQTVFCSVHAPFFASDEMLVKFVERAVADAHDPMHMLRRESEFQ